MKILYVQGKFFAKAIIEALCRLGHEVETYPQIETNVFVRDEVVEAMVSYIHERRITHVFSIHLLPNLAVAAKTTNVKYLSMIWDAPYYQAFTSFGHMENCYFSVFDKEDYGRFLKAGIPHVLYQPLSIDWKAAWQWYGRKADYREDISFVGNLYDDSLYDDYMQNIPEELNEYFIDIFEKAAFYWDDINRIPKKENRDILQCLREKCPDFILINPFEIEDVKYFESYYLARKLTNIERICLLNLLAEKYKVSLYTSSTKDVAKLKAVHVMPPVDAIRKAPEIFHTSKINLNITLRSIERGTPQRVMDIMEAGGFVLSSFSSETAELFVEDKEIVMFRTLEELLDKAEYYLSHDKERESIARAGYKKVMMCYTYDIKLKAFLDWVEERG